MKNTKTKSIVALAIVLVLTVVFGIVGVTGMSFQGGLWKLLPWLPTTNADAWPQAISLGLDLRGGVYVEYSAEAPEGNDANFSDLLDATVSAIQSRLTDKGYAESTVQVLGTSGIRVEIPDVSDPSEILNLIGEPALLEFKDPDGNTFMTGSDVRLAQAAMTQDGQWAISFQLTSAGTKLFADMTSQNIGKTLGIYLDGEKLMAPTVQSAITGGSGQITGNFTMDRAQTIAAQIQSGALPLVLTQQKVDTVSATLGDNALSTSVFAAIIGIALVMLIMIVRYRLNGVVASWALCIYTIVLFWVLAVFPGIQLTLPGIAGIVLGIGMAVDANVVIFERFNEEVRAGRSLKVALKTGFHNALSAIIDANVTTIIAAIVLMIFGTGSVQGFAKTLLLGVIVSLFSALLVTRFLMKQFIQLKNWNALSPPAFSLQRRPSNMTIKNYSKQCLMISAGIMVLALLLSLFGMGINVGIDFSGGMSMQYTMGEAVTQSDIEGVLNGIGLKDYAVSVQGTGKDSINIRIKAIDEDGVQGVQASITEALQAKYPNAAIYGDVNYVGPVAGATLLRNAFLSVLIAALCMLIYIAIRFDFNSGAAAVLGLVHDVLIMLSFMVILRSFVQMNSSFIAAMLTIVGYSINNTIIIFDRIRENARKMPSSTPRVDVVNRSIKECLGRTINTTLTTLVTIVCLYIFGVSSIREFALPIIVGIISGVYSANMINGYVWAFLEEKKRAKKAAKA